MEQFAKKSVSFEEYLEKNGQLIHANSGVSMLPLLREGKDLFIINNKEKINGFSLGMLYCFGEKEIMYSIGSWT